MLRHGRTDICDRFIPGMDSQLIQAQDELVIVIGLKWPPASACVCPTMGAEWRQGKPKT